jgi:Fe-S cluster assembly scaffold protein SufB
MLHLYINYRAKQRESSRSSFQVENATFHLGLGVVISKGISTGGSSNTYRGLVKVGPKASKTQNYSQCRY